MDMESTASAASGPNHSSGSAHIHSYPNSEYLEVKNENTVDSVVNGINDNKNTYGSDFGSETDEGFVSGGEEFETDSVAGRAAVMDPDEEAVAKITNDDAADTSVMGSSEFSMSEGVRPIAKVSTDDDEEEDVQGDLEDEGLGGKVVQDSSDEKDNLGGEAVDLEEDKGRPVQAESAKYEYFGENVEISADGGDKDEDDNLERNVPSVVEGGLASEQYEVEQSEVIDDENVSLNDKHKKAPTGDENVGGTVIGNSTPNGANDDAESAAAGKLDGASSVPSDDVKLTYEGDSIVENVKANISEPGDVVIGDVKDTRDFKIEGVEKKGAPSDDVKVTSEGDSIVENVNVNISEPGVVVVGDVKDTREFEIEGIEKNGAPCVPSDDVKLTSEGDSIVENVKVNSLEPGVVVVGDVKITKDLEIEEVEKNGVPCVSSDDARLTSEGDSIVEDVNVSFPEPELVVVGDVKDERDLEIQGVEKNGTPCVPSDDVKLTSEGDSIVEDVKINFPEPGVVVVGDAKDTLDLQSQGVEVPANGVSLANGFNQVEEDGHRAKNIDDHSMEKNGNLGTQTGKVEMSGKEKLGSSVDQLNGDGENENSEAKSRDSVVRMDNDQIEAVPSDALNRVDEIQCGESEAIASAVPDNGRMLHDGVFNMNPVTNEGESKTSGEYDASEDLGPSSIMAADEEGRFADEEIEDSITDGETEGMIFESSEAAKEFLEELEKASGVGSLSTMEDSHDLSQKLDGQIVTDSDEEVDTDEEGESKELFDPAALAALLKAARGTGSDGGSITITSEDGSRLFPVDRPAGLGSSLQSVKPGPRTSRGSIFSPSSLRVEADSDGNVSEQEKKKLENLQQVRIKFLRLVQRLGFTPEESMAAQVLYRLTLVAGRQTGGLFSLDTAKRIALELEAEGRDDLNFTINILVLGKAGVGKSATINSIFGETKTQTDAYGPATSGVREIVGLVGGVKLRVFDTPGLKSSAMEQSVNRKILSNVKNFTKKCPPDIILYVDRLDTQTRDLNDLPLLRSITSVLGPSIWRNAIVTLTHAASAPPDGPTGSPLSYDVFVAQRSHVIQQNIGQAVGDLRLMNPSLMNPVSLAENHPSCRKNRDGEKVLPNGQSWRPQLLLLCYSMKILSEASSLSKPKDPFDHKKLFGFRVRAPPLPYLLSGLLQSRTHPKLSADQGGDNGDSDIDMADLSGSDHDEDEDEYDQLPAFKPLKKSQIAKLSREQKKAYFDEYDYRVKLLQKKQWREELKRMREMKKKGKASGDDYGETEEGDDSPAAVAVPLPDMVLPPSFDGDNAAFRYRFLEPTSQFLTRPVLDTHGWDHDCGYDGVNLEHSLAIASRFPAAYAVQITKDKKDFNIHLDSSVAAKHGENGSTMAGFDIQNIGKQLAYIVRGETKFKNFKRNKTAAGISVTFLGENVSTGVKVEDQIAIGKRLVLVGSTGTVRSQGDAAYGANMEVRIREADYPIEQDQSSLGLSLVKWRGDLALGANFQSQFSVGRSYKMAVRAGLNNKLSGQITVKTSSSDQLQIALVAILPIVRAIYKNFWPGASENYSIY